MLLILTSLHVVLDQKKSAASALSLVCSLAVDPNPVDSVPRPLTFSFKEIICHSLAFVRWFCANCSRRNWVLVKIANHLDHWWNGNTGNRVSHEWKEYVGAASGYRRSTLHFLIYSQKEEPLADCMPHLVNLNRKHISSPICCYGDHLLPFLLGDR